MSHNISKVITGTSGADIISDDRIYTSSNYVGGLGNDTYIVGANNPDLVFEGINAGIDTLLLQSGDGRYVTGNAYYTLTDNVENLTTQFQHDGTFVVNQNRNPGDEIQLSTFGGVNANINGNALNNVIKTGNGDDTINGNGGKDTFLGGNGNDTYYVDSSDDVIVEQTHLVEFSVYNQYNSSTQATALLDIAGQHDRVYSTAANYTLSANIETLYLQGSANINGTGNAGNNGMYGNNGNNTMTGLGGNDGMYGNGGNDKLLGGDGNDTLNGGNGDNTLDGGNGNDLLYANGFNSKDLVIGGAGNDVFYGDDNALDTMVGGAGNDKFYGDTTDIITEAAGEGTDSVIIWSGAYVNTYTLSANVENLDIKNGDITNVTANAGNNHIVGNSYGNTILGLAGEDLLDGQNGADTLIGGDGNDSYVVDNAGDVVIETNASALVGGVDTVYSSAYSYTLGANIENLTLATSFGNAYIGIGNALNNIIQGNNNNNTLIGGAGNDTYYVNALADSVIEQAGEGTQDKIILTSDFNSYGANYFIAANVENLDASATQNGVWVTGNSSNNNIKGGLGNDVLDGRGGNDTLAGGKGDDSYVVDSATDVVTEAAGAGTDSVYINQVASFTLGANVENAYMLAGVNNVTGNAANNIITGNANANSITGGAGNDYLAGGYGIDTLNGGDGNDTLNGGAGADSLIGGLGNDTYIVSTGDVISGETGGMDAIQTDLNSYSLNGAGVTGIENLSFTGIGNFTGSGNALANKITGAGGLDTLNGGAGNDTLDGGAGVDSLVGGIGDDTYYVDDALDVTVEAAAEGTDTVIASVSYTLQANVENLTLAAAALNLNATGNALDNVLTGDAGSNTLNGLAGADKMIGGKGNDNYIVDNASDVVTETYNYANAGGYDKVYLDANINYTLTANVEDLILNVAENLPPLGQYLTPELTLTGNAAITGNLTLTGNATGNYIAANAGNNLISGLDGDDTLLGRAGNDTLLGGKGNDYLDGGADNDSLDGGAGNDTLDGGTGNDSMLGGAGDDTYIVDVATDVVTELLGAGTDTAVYINAGTYTLSANVENADVYSGFAAAVSITGNILANTISTDLNANVDTIDGGAGVDTLITSIGNVVGFNAVNAETANSTLTGIENVILTTNGDYYGGDNNSWNMGGTFDGTAAAHNHITITGGQLGGSGLALSGFGKNVDFTLQNEDTFGGVVNLSGVTGGWAAGEHLAVTVDNFGGGLQADLLGHLDITSTGDNGSNIDVTSMNTTVTNISVTGDKALAINSMDAGSTLAVNNFTGSYLNLSLINTVATNDTLNVDVNNVNTALHNVGSVEALTITSTGNNTLSGLSGVNTTVDGTGSLTLNNVHGTINASAFTGELIVNADNSINITGGTGDDYITGGFFSIDTINGGAGSDVLTGGLGNSDTFVFSDAPAAGIDLITDYQTGFDGIQLSLGDFAGLGVLGALSGANFLSAANVDDVNLAGTNAYVLYDSASGALYYDATGNSVAGDAVQFAQIGLTSHASLTAADFTLIA